MSIAPHTSPMPAPQRKWTDGEREVVKALLAHGATASVVAREMGIGRNAALGRIYRDPEMALRAYAIKPKVNRPPRPMTPRPVRPPAVITETAGDVEASAAPATPAAPPKPSRPHPMALIGTGSHWCKWPVVEDHRVLGGFLCCGSRSLPGDVYCSEHREKAKRAIREVA